MHEHIVFSLVCIRETFGNWASGKHKSLEQIFSIFKNLNRGIWKLVVSGGRMPKEYISHRNGTWYFSIKDKRLHQSLHNINCYAFLGMGGDW